jgi:type II secretory ATPase GspE/PulE/Tfp pilus assembly ATPase PilB-like protein
MVLSTLHTNDAPTAVVRLQEMGVPAYLIASTLGLVVAQRLARRLCPRCKEMLKSGHGRLTAEEQVALGDATTVAEARGCSRGYNTGYSGRVGLFEVMPVTPAMRQLIIDYATADALRDQARSEGVRSLREDGLRKVRSGLTTIEEVHRVTA